MKKVICLVPGREYTLRQTIYFKEETAMKKRIMVALLSAVMVMSMALTACGSKEESPKEDAKS